MESKMKKFIVYYKRGYGQHEVEAHSLDEAKAAALVEYRKNSLMVDWLGINDIVSKVVELS